ncbi:MAG TPA: response regulator [Acidobacteriaceae bacterium]|nr:response regulator [Acidobacteriaceae bacterium]
MSEQNVVDAPEQFGGDGFDGDDFDGAANEGGGPAAPGMGQSKSSRRRRRKRKNKLMAAASTTDGGGVPAATDDASPAPGTIVMEGESLALAGGAAPVRRPQPQGTGQQPQFGQGQGGKRWKKKFRDRERRTRNDNPGNDFRSDNGGGYSNGNGGYGGGNGYRQNLPDNFGNLVGGFKRKNKGGQSRDRGFVGPMDHSYRAGDANYADAPPSTIQVHGHRRHRHQGDNQPLDFSGPRPVPIPEDAQTHIYLFIEDLFLTAKINEAARKLGVKVAFVKNDKDALADLTSGEDENKPSLIVFDLNNANAKPLTVIPKLKAKLKRSASIVGFLSHLQGDLKAKAVEAGCDVVMPRAAFSQNLPNLLRRYGIDDEEEVNFNH